MSAAVLAVLLFVAVYFLSRVIIVAVHNYRAHGFFKTKSPRLPVVPGPNLFLGNIDQTVWALNNCELIDRWHDELGKTFGHYVAEQPWVATKDIDLLKRIMIDDASKHLDRIFTRTPLHELNTSIAQINGDEWHRVRMAIAPTMTNLRVRSAEVSPDIENVVGQFVKALKRRVDAAAQATGDRSVVLSVHDHMERITLAVVFSVMYRKENVIDFDADEDSWIKEFAQAETSMMNPYVKLTWALPFLAPLFTWLFQFTVFGRSVQRVVTYIKQAADVRQVAQARKQAKLADQGPRLKRQLIDGFIDMLIEKRITMRQYIGTAYFMLIAGYDTSANTATSLLWQLAHNMDIQHKLRKALKTDGMDADYVVWCIMETIRWHPAVPLGTGRILTEDVTTNDGLLIPKGSYVTPSTYSIHHDDSVWPDADRFMPERWRDQSNFHPAAFMGFGLGPRNCVGSKMAVHELKLMIQAIIMRYKVAPCEETIEQYDFISPGLIFTIPAKPVKLRFTPVDTDD